jgi:hypothetical protein
MQVEMNDALFRVALQLSNLKQYFPTKQSTEVSAGIWG